MTAPRKLLVANRGEIAVRIMRTASEMGLETVGIAPDDDFASLHIREANEAVLLPGAGAQAYLAIDNIINVARTTGCGMIHPGYGFLSESAAFAAACVEAGLAFVGPTPDTLALFGDKVRARNAAKTSGLPLLPGSSDQTTLAEAQAFFASLEPGEAMMIKALAGGGGRGMRPVTSAAEVESAFNRCAAEALAAFGDGSLYVEQILHSARHIEVQLVGDGSGAVTHLGTRECSLQRQRQKLVEWAPAISLPNVTRDTLLDGAIELGRVGRLRSLATVEFLVADDRIAFLEVNPRLQVEHTVTEEVTGLDLVRIQLEIAQGATLADLNLDTPPILRGMALQARINLETMNADGGVQPAAGIVSSYLPPTGRAIRVDGFGTPGYHTNLRYDSLLAKLIVAVPGTDITVLVAKARRALADFRVEGVPSNIPFLRSLLADAAVVAGKARTDFVDKHVVDLLAEVEDLSVSVATASSVPTISDFVTPIGSVAILAPMAGTLVTFAASSGDAVTAGQEIGIIEAMKMQHGLVAPVSGTFETWEAALGQTVAEGQPVGVLRPGDSPSVAIDETPGATLDPDRIRPDLAAVLSRQGRKLDEERPDAVARRRKTGQRTARENIDDLCDAGSFVEYGGLAIAGRSRRASPDELIAQSPADGLVMGLGTVNCDDYGPERSRVAALSYDYSVFAGTQGARNHLKTDRLVELAHRWRLPIVFFTEGGGGRPGDTDGGGFIRAFELFGKMSGRAPLVGIASGRCFAGNAALLGCCDVIIATRNISLGMGGPAMIEGGGLGVFAPEQIGPADVHVANGVIDVLTDDEAAATAVAKHYLSFFQGTLSDWHCVDQKALRHLVPENRLRVYDVRAVIETLVDSHSMLELRRGFGLAMVTVLARIEGRPVGIIANDPGHLGGAIDSDAADKAARFMALCDAYQLPLVSLSDTPGIMVGPEVEKTGLVRHAARMFVIGANLSVPILSVVLRKSYGLGAIAMTGGSYQASLFAVSWPTGEFGGMGIEGAVKLGYRKELEAIADPVERQAKFDQMVAAFYAHGQALTMANSFAIDNVIDPADTRRWISTALRSVPADPQREADRPRWIDSW